MSEAMKVLAWRTVINNPCSAPATFISIAPDEFMCPWVIPIDGAVKIFGQDDIDTITLEPRQVFLTLTAANKEEP
jgi:hypothetical protein